MRRRPEICCLLLVASVIWAASAGCDSSGESEPSSTSGSSSVGGGSVGSGASNAGGEPSSGGAGGAGGGGAGGSSSSGGVCAPGSTAACYDGPPATDGVGTCVAGTTTCSREGEWGPCEGQVLPAAEDCATPEDEDCAGIGTCSSGDILWAVAFTGPEQKSVTAIAPTAGGGVVVGGIFNGTIDFGAGPVGPAPGVLDDGFVAALDASGSVLWATTFGSSLRDDVSDIAVGPSGEIVVTGYYESALSIGAMTLANSGGRDVFVAVFAPDGSLVSAKGFGSSGHDTGGSVGVDASGDIHVSGYQEGSIDWGGGPLPGPAGVLLRLHADLGFADAKAFPGASFGSIAVTSDARVGVAGTFSGSADFGSGPMTSLGEGDLFIGVLDTAGVPIWGRHDGSPATENSRSSAIDPAGGMLVAGLFYDTLDFGTGAPLVAAGGTQFDAWVARFDPSGAATWALPLSSQTYDWTWSVALDAAGNAVVTGYAVLTLSVAGTAIPLQGSSYVLKIDPTGALVWVVQPTIAGDADFLFASAFGESALFIGGDFSFQLDGPNPLVNSGIYDAFVMKIAP